MRKNTKIAKYSIIIILLLLFSLIIWSIEEGLDGSEKEKSDRDNINVVNKIGNQSFDKAQQLYFDSRSRAS